MTRLILFIFFVSLCWSCDDDSEKTACDCVDNSYFPLAIGNSWEYVPVAQNGISKTVVVSGTVIMDNHTYYMVIASSTYNGTTHQDTVYYRMDAMGYVYERQPDASVEINRFRLNTADGDTWQMPAPQMDAYTVTTTVMDNVQLTPLIAVPDGKSFYYDVPQYADEEHYIVLAKGLGIVKQGSSWGFDVRLKRAIINGQQYNY